MKHFARSIAPISSIGVATAGATTGFTSMSANADAFSGDLGRVSSSRFGLELAAAAALEEEEEAGGAFVDLFFGAIRPNVKADWGLDAGEFVLQFVFDASAAAGRALEGC